MSLLRACNADLVLSSVDLARVLFRTVGYMLSLLQFHFLMLSSNSGEKKKQTKLLPFSVGISFWCEICPCGAQTRRTLGSPSHQRPCVDRFLGSSVQGHGPDCPRKPSSNTSANVTF